MVQRPLVFVTLTWPHVVDAPMGFDMAPAVLLHKACESVDEAGAAPPTHTVPLLRLVVAVLFFV
jgi:hypothetical protein